MFIFRINKRLGGWVEGVGLFFWFKFLGVLVNGSFGVWVGCVFV